VTCFSSYMQPYDVSVFRAVPGRTLTQFASGDKRLSYVHPRETPLHTRTARAQPPAAHRRRHSRPHRCRHGEHSPTAHQPHSNGLCSPPREGPGPGSALRHVDDGPSTERSDEHLVSNGGSFLPHSSFVFSKRKLQKLCVGRWGACLPVNVCAEFSSNL